MAGPCLPIEGKCICTEVWSHQCLWFSNGNDPAILHHPPMIFIKKHKHGFLHMSRSIEWSYSELEKCCFDLLLRPLELIISYSLTPTRNKGGDVGTKWYAQERTSVGRKSPKVLREVGRKSPKVNNKLSKLWFFENEHLKWNGDRRWLYSEWFEKPKCSKRLWK